MFQKLYPKIENNKVTNNPSDIPRTLAIKFHMINKISNIFLSRQRKILFFLKKNYYY